MPQLPGFTAGGPGLSIVAPAQHRPGMLGQALAHVGAELDQTAQFFQRREEEDGRIWATKRAAEERIGAWKKMEEDRQAGAPLTDYASSIKTYMEERWAAAEADAGAVSPSARRYLSQMRVDVDGDLTMRAVGLEGEDRVNRTIAGLGDAQTALANQAASDPTTLASALAQYDALVDTTALPFEARARAKAGRATIAAAGITSLIERDPSGTLTALRAGRYDGVLEPQQRLALERAADSEVEHRRAKAEAARQRAAAAETAAVSNRLGALSIMINDAENSGDLEALDAYRKELITLGGAIGFDKVDDYVNRTGDATAKLTASAVEAQRIADALAGGGGLANTDDNRKGLDAYYRMTVAPGLAEMAPDARADAVAGLSAQAGMVPETVAHDVDRTMMAGSPERQLEAARMFERLTAANPAFASAFSQTTQRKAALVATYSQLGVSDPVAKADEQLKVDEPTRKAREGWLSFDATKQGGDTVGASLEEAVRADPSWSAGGLLWGSAVDLLPVEMTEEYRAAAAREYVATGDQEVAAKQAWRQVNAKWGVTRVNGAEEVAPWAPEKFYGVEGLSPSENAAWISEQALADAQTLYGETPTLSGQPLDGRLQVRPHPTIRSADGKPVYALGVSVDDGMGGTDFFLLNDGAGQPVAWRPDFGASPLARREAEAARGRAADAMSQAEYLRRGREGTRTVEEIYRREVGGF